MNLHAADMERCLLAVSNGQLTTKQITDALVEWQRNRHESLLEIVRRQTGVELQSVDDQDSGKSLSEAAKPALPQDPFQTLNASGTDQPPALLSADTPASHDGASLYQTRISSDLPSSSQPISVAASPMQAWNRSSRFEIVRQHARGGLGEVFVAQDHELDRQVAVKQILAHHRYDAECRSRFVLEAQITGRLEHPGIVPVYGLGNDVEGRLYYAMRFIQGESLQQAIDHFYKQPHTDIATAGLHSIPFRKLLTRFSHVCNIVEYAHAKGILHRDIKPANIMLGKYDETLLVDWGLAKVLGTMDPEVAENPMATKRISGVDSSQTRYGAMVGTPAFMSPEQAKGLHAEVDSRSDIYSLGATLYCLLTGQPPFGSNGSGSYLDQVKRGEFTPPRQVRGHIPKPLEAICMKAMAVQPASRYQHAADIAEDIDRWLADEPIATYAESSGERIGRWIRHNRSLLMFGMVSMILLTIGSIGAFIVVNGLRSEAQLALEAKNRTWDEMIREKENAIQMQQLAEESRIAAEKASQLATDARELSRQEAKRANELSDFLLSLFRAADPVHQGRSTFSGKPASINLTARDLLDRGAMRLTQQGALLDSPLSRAAVLSTIGDVYRQLSLFADAEPLLVEALSIRRQNNATVQEIIESEFELASLFHEQGDYDRGREHYQVALSMQEEQGGENAELFLASILNNFGWMLANEGGTEEGKKLFLQAAAIRERKLGSQHRDTLFSRIGAAFCMIEQHRYGEALPIIVQASQSLTKVDDNHNITQALTHFGTGLIYRQTLGNTAAEKEFRETIRLTEMELGANNVYLALARFELAATLADLQRDTEALEQLEICLRIARESVQLRHPRIRALISLYTRLIAKQGKHAEADALWQDFLTAQRTRFGMEHRFYYEALLGYTIFLRKVDRDAESIELYQKILEGVSGLQFNQKPWLLAMTYSEYSSVLCDLDRFSEAQGIAIAGIKQFEANPELIKEYAVDWMYLHADLAECFIHLEDGKASEQLEKALGLAKKITTNERSFATHYVLSLATSWHLKQKDHAGAIPLLNSRKALARQLPKEMLTVAKDFLRCCRLVEQDDELSSDDKEQRIAEYATSAVETLQVAIRAGLTLNEKSVESKLFDRIREREDFQSLLGSQNK